jgi:hypothetical protein
VFWIENTDGLGNFTTEHVVDINTSSHYSAYPVYINDDNLVDIVITSTEENKIAWYENGVLGINDNNKQTAILYPNPTNGILQINTHQEISFIEIYNLVGQKVLETKSEIDISNLVSGVYFVIINNEDGYSETYKIIKE